MMMSFKFGSKGNAAAARALVKNVREGRVSVHAHDEDYSGASVLTCVASCGLTDEVDYLLDVGANVLAVSNNGNTALTAAITYGRAATAELLIQRGALVNGSPPTQRAPLYLAVAYDLAGVALQLLDKGADVNAPAMIGDAVVTPLIMAARMNTRTVVRALLLHGADAVPRADYGETAFDVAVRCNFAQLIVTLLASGCSPMSLDTEKRR
jgi:ankyrin repeat protein